MASTASEIRELPDNDQSSESHVERAADDTCINMPRQAGRDVERSAPWFLAYSGLIQIWIAILQLHSQGSSPFDTHPAIMWIFMFAVFIHYGAALYYTKSLLDGSRRSKICDLVGYVSGSLASAAFLSILVPPSLVPLVYVIWTLHLPIYFEGARDWILEVAKNIYPFFSNGVVGVFNSWRLVCYHI